MWAAGLSFSIRTCVGTKPVDLESTPYSPHKRLTTPARPHNLKTEVMDI